MTLHTPTPLAASLEAMDNDDPRLSLLFDDHAAIVIDATDGAVVYANPAAAQLFGAERSDQLSADPGLLRGPGADRLRALGENLNATGDDLPPRIEMLRFFVGARTVAQGFTCSSLAAAPLHSQPADDMTRIRGNGILAVSVRKVAGLPGFGERAGTLFDQSPDPVIIRDAHDTVLYRNAAAEQLGDATEMHETERQAGPYRIVLLHRPALDRLAGDTAAQWPEGSAREEPEGATNDEDGDGTSALHVGDPDMAPDASAVTGGSASVEKAGEPHIGTRFRFALNQNAEVSDASPALSRIGLQGDIGSAMDDLVAGDPMQLARAIEARDTFNRISIQWRAADGGAPLNILLSGLPILDGEGGFHGLRAFGVVGARAAMPAGHAAPSDDAGSAPDETVQDRDPAGSTDVEDAPETADQAADTGMASGDDEKTVPAGSMSERLEKLVTAGAGLATGGVAAGLSGIGSGDEDTEPAVHNTETDGDDQPADDPGATSAYGSASAIQISAEDIPARRPMRPTEETLRAADGLARSDQQALDEIAERLGADHPDPDASTDDSDDGTDAAPGASGGEDSAVSATPGDGGGEVPDDTDAEDADGRVGDRVLVPFARPSASSDTRIASRGSTDELEDDAGQAPPARDWARIASAATALGGLGAGLGLMNRGTGDHDDDAEGGGAAGEDREAEPPTVNSDIIDLVERLPLGMLFVREEAPLYANRAFLDLFGYADIDDLVAEGGMPALFENLSDTNVPGKRMLTGITRDHRPFQVEARLQMAKWLDGPAVLLSIRERDRFDTEPLENADAEIAELRDVLDAVPDSILVTDRNGRIRAMNAAARDLLGPLDRAEQPPLLSALFADDGQPVIARTVDAITSDDAPDRPEPIRASLIARDGNRMVIDAVLTLIGIGMREKVCAILRRPAPEGGDVDAATGSVSAANSSDVLAKVSHEIRTPINAIIGFADMMLDEQYGPIGHERYTGYLRDIKSSGAHIVSLVNDLLDLSKVEAGMLDLEFAETRLNDVVEQCAAIMQSQANRDNVILRTSLAQNLPPVVADIRSVRQILLNLLSNAVKFTDTGGQVIVSTMYTDHGAVELRVRDTGIGMSEEDIAKALEPYRQSTTTAPNHPNQGSGIGLPLTRALAEANRAGFSIDSTPGDGTTVRVAFPPTRVLAE